MTYRYLPHTADIKVAIEAPSFEALFHDGVTVVRHLLVGESAVEPCLHQSVRLDADNAEELLLGFLRDLLYRYEISGFIPLSLTVEHLDTTKLVGSVSGEPIDGARHQPEPEVKAVTRHGFAVARTSDGWCAEIVFDV